ncbi:MAG TPA: DUF1330 domain-containing protein [Chloroflexota bacterium]|nr:DUF1330 domain-containing protein [Chloroflexota bacterium]
MAAYLIYARKDIVDQAKSVEYAQRVVPQIKEYGGEIVAARGQVQVLEGDWNPPMLTILRFPTKDQLLAWYTSADYAPLKELRLQSSHGDVVIVEGT